MSRISLDRRDLELLAILSREGRITKAALAEALGQSASATWERLRRLEKAGVIAGYGARVSLRHLGPHVIVFVSIELAGHAAADFRFFEGETARHDEITEVWSLGGGVDYIIKVVTKDIDAYQRLMDALLASRAGIARYTTWIVTKAVKQSPPDFARIAGEDPG